MRAERLQTSGSGTRRRELASRTALSISCSLISARRSGGEGARDWRLVTGAFQDAQRWTMERAVHSPVEAAVTTRVSLASRTGRPMADLPVGCKVPLVEDRWLEDTA